MARTGRQRSESGIYHVIARGVGRCIIFEDDTDRSSFLYLIRMVSEGSRIGVIAWCLMDNHTHLLLRGELSSISELMKSVLSRYAVLFNSRHGRVGHLFQGRFSSVPIDDDRAFLITIRYIHRNPIKAGLTHSCDYRWSSYSEYIGEPSICETTLALEMLGGKEGFAEFHRRENVEDQPLDGRRCRIDAAAASRIARDLLQGLNLSQVASLERSARNEAIRTLRRGGLSVRQIERMTGIGRGVIQRIK